MIRAMRRAVLLAALVAGFALPAAADYIGNPVKDLKAKQPAVEGASTSDTTQFVGDYALTDAGTVQARYGLWDESGIDGDVFGAGYFHTLADSADVEGKPVRFGVFGLHRIFTASDGGLEFDFTTTQLGGGATMEATDRLFIYGLGALELWKAEASATVLGQTVKASDDGKNFGYAAGAEFAVSDRFRAGVEVQSGFELDDTTSFFARLSF